jgi:tetratricopeptide (TPR) repeat protein
MLVIRYSRGGSPLDEGLAAYRQGQWSRAVIVARTRLQAAPEDREAIRLLARSMARLGRGGQANSLFKRLGEHALAAEDLYLLGLGLNQAGQADSALAVWEKALGQNPDHAESLERLARAYTARNRLVEAARLYDRLAHLPGWEVRGGLNLASLRAELNDPAGAAAILEQALARPDAKSLDASILDSSRKLLARTLLRTGKAAAARAELENVLEPGADQEAFWLLSRVFLQEGKREQSVAALEKAASYRHEHPLELEPGLYVGETRCIECHREIARAYHGSRFTTTLVRGESLLALPYPDQPVADPADGAVTHRFLRSEGRVRVETEVEHKIERAIVDYAFGSPDRYTSLVGRDEQGRSLILRLSHYRSGPSESGWVRTTGHTPLAEGGRDFLGKALDPADGVLKCLFCHSTNPQAVLAGGGPESKDRAIGCERCHGPGGNHLKAVEMKLPDRAIVSPAQGTGEGSVRLCAQCHAFHQTLDLPRTDPYWIRFQGNGFAWSRCYTESAGALDCMTCHDPHRNAEHSASFYEAKCLTCHHPAATPRTPTQPVGGEQAKKTGVTTCPVNPARDCLGCHMPPFRSEPLHATFADHYIRVHTESTLPRGDASKR